MQQQPREAAAGDAAARVRELAQAALDCAARQAARDADAPPAGELRTLLYRMCDVARAQGLRVEQLLLILKEEWHQRPRSPRAVPDGREALAWAVSLCIEEYYAPRGRD